MINCWKTEKNKFHGTPLAILCTGPSYDAFDLKLIDGWHVFAINAAITEVYQRPDTFWVCHDLWKIWKSGLAKRIPGYDSWNLITRRVYLPGQFGAIDYRAVGGGRIRKRFQYTIDKGRIRISRIWWYTELSDQEGYIQAEETVMEIALDVATCWGFSPIVIVGMDMGPKVYSSKWDWKSCKIRPDKFERMKAVLVRERDRWSRKIYTLSPHWSGSFERIGLDDLARKSTIPALQSHVD
jgi:hypothetical protein